MIDMNAPAVLTAKSKIRKACVDLFKTALELPIENFNPWVEFYGHSNYLTVGYSNEDGVLFYLADRFPIYADVTAHVTQKTYINELKSCLSYIQHVRTQLIEQHAIHTGQANS